MQEIELLKDYFRLKEIEIKNDVRNLHLPPHLRPLPIEIERKLKDRGLSYDFGGRTFYDDHKFSGKTPTKHFKNFVNRNLLNKHINNLERNLAIKTFDNFYNKPKRT